MRHELVPTDPASTRRTKVDASRGAQPQHTALLELQRTAGNAAVQHLVQSRGQEIALQRNGASGKLLTDLAVPKTFPGPEVKLQKELWRALEDRIKEALKSASPMSYIVMCLGGIELPSPGGKTVDDLIQTAKLVDLGAAAAVRSRFNLIADAPDVQTAIIKNTLATMESAGQLNYLRESRLIDKDWKVLIEVHYYRDRDKGATKFHKDTLGQTLFVNLNFLNDAAVPGPEYILNPAKNETWDKDLAVRLPKVFVDDLNTSAEHHGRPTIIGDSTIPPHGVIAFVDELIHHKTPTRRHRTVPGAEIEAAVLQFAPDQYKVAKKAFKAYQKDAEKAKKDAEKAKKPKDVKSFADRVNPKISTDASDQWFRLIKKLNDDGDRAVFDRTELRAILPGEKIDRLIEKSSWPDFGEASHPKPKLTPQAQSEGGSFPVKAEGAKPLPRVMSQKFERGEMTQQKVVPEDEPKRTFFRTWVRAVRR